MRLRKVQIQVLTIVFALIAAKPVHGQEQPRTPVTPERTLYKGRLASVEFVMKVEPKRRVIKLTFVVDAAWAMGPFDQDFGPRMAQVVTDWPAGDLSGLSSANYVETINSMLRNDVRVGDSYIVTSHHPGAYGPELLTIQASTQASDEKFLADNREYILNNRWFYDRIALQAKLMRLGTVRQEIRRLAADRQAMAVDARASSSLKQLIDSKAVAGEEERKRFIQEVAGTVSSLKDDLSRLSDALEQQYMSYRIEDADRTLADLKAFTFSATP